jgi:membrane protein YdbS with pleckstrin-like domain
MKRWVLTFLFLISHSLFLICAAQCSICTKTAQQLGEKPAQGLNAGILYLAFAPFAIVGLVAYRWWKNNRQSA